MKAKISVIIPAYNAQRYIPLAVDSVLSQTFKNYEIIVVDDGSTDKTREILIARYGTKIKYIFQENRGHSAARNTGIKNASGELMAFLDADDIWLPEKLRLQLEAMERHPEIGLVGCGTYDINESGVIGKETKSNNALSRKDLLYDLVIRGGLISGGASGVLVRKKCFDEIGLFDETLRASEDRDMWLRILRAYDIMLLDEPLAKIRVHKESLSKKTPLMKYYQKRLIRSQGKYIGFSQRQKAYSYLYLDAAREYFTFGKRAPAAFNAFLAIAAYPFKIYRNDDDKYQIFIKSFLTYSLAARLKKAIKRVSNALEAIADKIKNPPLSTSYKQKQVINGVLEEIGPQAKILNIGSKSTAISNRVINIDIVQYSNVNVVGDAQTLPFADSVFDAVFIIAVLEIVRDPKGVVSEAHRVLKTGGKVIATLPFLQPYHPDPTDCQRFTKEGAENLFAQFKTIKLTNTRGAFAMFVWVLRDFLSIIFSFNSIKLWKILNIVFGWLLFPLKYLDYIAPEYKQLYFISSSFLYEGERK